MNRKKRVRPVIGNWYKRLDKGVNFEVIDLDDDEDVIEIQYFDGDLDTIGYREWFGLDLEEIEEPEDWRGPIDSLEEGDFGYDDDEFEKSSGPGRKPG